MENTEPGSLVVPAQSGIEHEPTTTGESIPMPQFWTAASPFDRFAADVVLQSSDKVNFYVYKTVLLLASSFFETMFSLTQPSSERDNASPQLPERPIIEVSEDSETLDALLRFCYPVDDPEIQTLEQLDKVLEAALKYDIPVAVNILRRTLRTFVPAHPREAFAFASRYALEEEAQTAAQAWKGAVNAQAISEKFEQTFAGATYITALSGINAGVYHRLLSYLRTGHLPSRFCSPPVPALDQQVTGTASSFSASDGDVVLKSSQDARCFKVHRLVLTINNFDVLLADASPLAAIDSIPAYQVASDITSDILETLLLLCYPDGYVEDIKHGPIPGGTYSRLIEVATRYKMHTIIRTLRRNWTRDAVREPLTFYCIAARYGWLVEAQEAANLLLEAPLDGVYSPELEKATAASYQSLLKFHHLYRMIVMRGISKHGIKQDGYRTRDISGSDNMWTKGWLGDPASAKYLRNVPVILAELYTQMPKQAGKPFDLRTLEIETQAVENTIKQLAQNVRVEF